MDSDIARYEQDRRRRLEEAAKSALLLQDGDTPQIRTMRLKLVAKKPGIKALLGGNPLSNEEFDELEQFFRLSRERI